MGAYPVPLGDDRLDVPVEGYDLRLDADLFLEFPGERDGHRLADLDDAAGQAEMAEQRGSRPAHDQHPALSEHRRGDREDRARWEQPIIHGSSPCPEAVDPRRRSFWEALRRRLSVPWRLTCREGSASRAENLKSGFYNNCFTNSRILCYTFPLS